MLSRPEEGRRKESGGAGRRRGRRRGRRSKVRSRGSHPPSLTICLVSGHHPRPAHLWEICEPGCLLSVQQEGTWPWSSADRSAPGVLPLALRIPVRVHLNLLKFHSISTEMFRNVPMPCNGDQKEVRKTGVWPQIYLSTSWGYRSTRLSPLWAPPAVSLLRPTLTSSPALPLSLSGAPPTLPALTWSEDPSLPKISPAFRTLHFSVNTGWIHSGAGASSGSESR